MSTLSETFEVARAPHHQDTSMRDFPGFIVAGVVDKYRSNAGARDVLSLITDVKRQLTVTGNDKTGVMTIMLNGASEETRRYLMSTLSIMTQPLLLATEHDTSADNFVPSTEDKGLAGGNGTKDVIKMERPMIAADDQSAA